jgi:hypothetical protein
LNNYPLPIGERVRVRGIKQKNPPSSLSSLPFGGRRNIMEY